MSKCIVYCLTCVTSGKKYVGWTKKTLDERWKAHCKRSKSGVITKLYSAMRAHSGADEWVKDILEELDDDIQARQREIHWISELNTLECGYNMTPGGDGCVLRGEQNPFFGRKHDPVMLARVRAELSEKLSGENNPQFGMRGELSPNWGKKRSKETRRKISEGNKGKHVSEKSRKKMREAAARSKEKRSESQRARRQREKEEREQAREGLDQQDS